MLSFLLNLQLHGSFIMHKEDIQQISVKMRDSTLAELKQIQQKVRAPGISDTIRRSVDITFTLTKYIEEGAKIYVETKKGETIKLTITGME